MLAKIPPLLKLLLPNRLWNFPQDEKVIYLSFDDGPIPEVTPWILAQLELYHARATFFCLGDNVRKHPELFKAIIASGHTIGNHTFNHLNGWSTSTLRYVGNVLKAQIEMERWNGGKIDQKLFRPPYGRIKEKQVRLLKKRGFQVVMWDVLSGDYNQRLSSEKCFRNVVKNARPGSIVVFHDSLKAEKNLKAVLPQVLEYFSQRGFQFRALRLPAEKDIKRTPVSAR